MTHRRDYRDIVIAGLADDEAALIERIATLEADVAIYRELAQQAIHALHNLTVERGRLREQHYRLVDEYRDVRGRLMRQATAA